MKRFFKLSELESQRTAIAKRYLEFLRIPEMSAGLYCLQAGEADPQSPHKQAEMYFVVSGRARMRIGSEDEAVSPGSVIFVEAGVEHRFHDIAENLEILVFFAPAET
jgi:mannose-6-phosphate isomerase-like protein (cupin superfamily)